MSLILSTALARGPSSMGSEMALQRLPRGSGGTGVPWLLGGPLPDWPALFTRLAREARIEAWRGPLVLDELPYLVESSPELPAVLQRWLDHEARELVVVLAGSSPHMMQGLALDGSAPLYGSRPGVGSPARE